MTQYATQVIPSVSKKKVSPPLENGDQLSADEFERRWEAMPDLKHAELIEGTVFIPPPRSHDLHGAPHFDLITIVGTYRMRLQGFPAAITAH